MATVFLDAGHGGVNPGATFEGRRESDDALELTLAVGNILEENGIDVEYSRTTDIYESPGQKAREAPSHQAPRREARYSRQWPDPFPRQTHDKAFYSRDW